MEHYEQSCFIVQRYIRKRIIKYIYLYICTIYFINKVITTLLMIQIFIFSKIFCFDTFYTNSNMSYFHTEIIRIPSKQTKRKSIRYQNTSNLAKNKEGETQNQRSDKKF